MRNGKVRVNLEIILEDGSREFECPVTLCGRCTICNFSRTSSEKISFTRSLLNKMYKGIEE